jgi:TolB-like protein
MSRSPSHFYEFGEFRLYADEHLFLRGNEVVTLPPKAFGALVMLVENSGRVVEKDELIKRLWPDSFVEETTLAQYIFNLRRALSGSRGTRQFIETVPKRGYRFVLKVKEGQDDINALEFKRSRVKPAVAREEPTTRETAINSLAVLPFTNVNIDPDTEYLSDGIIEWIVNSLSRLPQLRVMARSSVLRYRNKDVDPKEVGREMGVQAVVMGRLLRVDKRLIVKVEMVDVANGWLLWGEQYNHEISDIISLEEEIAARISENLRLRVTGEKPKPAG